MKVAIVPVSIFGEQRETNPFVSDRALRCAAANVLKKEPTK